MHRGRPVANMRNIMINNGGCKLLSWNDKIMYLDFRKTGIYFCLGTHQFDLFCTSTILISSSFFCFDPLFYFDQNWTSTCTPRPIRSPNLSKCRSTEVEVQKRSNWCIPVLPSQSIFIDKKRLKKKRHIINYNGSASHLFPHLSRSNV